MLLSVFMANTPSGAETPFQWLSLLVAAIACLYASVGHGGASGYLAVLAFFDMPRDEMVSTALILNLLVASVSFAFYYRAGHFRWALTWPFLLTSIPAALLGGLWAVQDKTYTILLAAALVIAALRMLWQFDDTQNEGEPPPLKSALPAGALIGLASGMVGVGGGIFLSPLMLFCRWGTLRQISATAALFIVANAAAGLIGRYSRDAVVIGDLWPLLLAGLVGGLLGGHLGSRRIPPPQLRMVLAAVLLIAAFKLAWPLLQAGLHPV